jgi:hypothetical protein
MPDMRNRVRARSATIRAPGPPARPAAGLIFLSLNGAAGKFFEEAGNENLFVVGITDFGADWLLL